MKYRSLVLVFVPTLLPLLSLPVTAQNCTVCPGGESLQYGDALLLDLTALEFNATTCGELEINADFTNSGDEVCFLRQNLIGIGQCGCDPPSGVCTVCPDSSSLVEPARVIDAAGTTCQSVAAHAAIVNASDPGSCDLFYLSAAACSCPAIQNGCTLCASGAPATNPSATFDLDPLGVVTGTAICEELEKTISYFDADSDYCRINQRAGALYCGCDFVPEEDVCTLCTDESLIENPNIVLGGSPGNDVTCGEASILSSLEKGADCSKFHAQFAEKCGCYNIETRCPLCYDDSTPQNVVFGSIIKDNGDVYSCIVEAADLNAFYSKGSPACTRRQGAAANACGCPPPSGTCSICPFGDPVPDKSLEVLGSTCGKLAQAAGQTVTDDCANFTIAGDLCGCKKESPSPTTQSPTSSPTSFPATSSGAGQRSTATLASLWAVAVVLALFVSMVA
jgi:hypothetical protein